MLKLALAALFTVFCVGASNAQTADYKDQQEMDAALLALDGALDGRVQVKRIARSELGLPIRVVTISNRTALPRPPRPVFKINPTIPGFFIECGMHAREWAASEACFNFLEDFIVQFESGTSARQAELREALSKVDIHVVPMVNPDGRAFDDTNGGDPFTFFTSNTANPGGGWRPNRKDAACTNSAGNPETGIDLARNFSNGWEQIPLLNNQGNTSTELICGSHKFRGDRPFDAKENRALRKFVNNHLIGQSLSVHGHAAGFDSPVNSQGAKVSNFINTFNAATSDSRLFLADGPGGGGFGQFPAWAIGTSNAVNLPDTGTVRGIFSYLLEIPPDKNDAVDAYSTYGLDYRVNPAAPQSPFHPTGQQFIDNLRNPVFESFLYLVKQARSPWRSLDPVTLNPLACVGSCPQDLALVGSKIQRVLGNGGIQISLLNNSNGILRMARNPQPLERANAGVFSPGVGVQNSNQGAGQLTGSVQFTVEETNLSTSNTVTLTGTGNDTRSVTLNPGQVRFMSGPSYTAVAGHTYKVTIALSPTDDENRNNTHVFRFEAR